MNFNVAMYEPTDDPTAREGRKSDVTMYQPSGGLAPRQNGKFDVAMYGDRAATDGGKIHVAAYQPTDGLAPREGGNLDVAIYPPADDLAAMEGRCEENMIAARNKDAPMIEAMDGLAASDGCSDEKLRAVGMRFKAKASGKWYEYSPDVNEVLKKGYLSGVNNIRFQVKGQLYKFSFERMEQTNVNTMITTEMEAPQALARPLRSSVCSWGNVASLSKGRQTVAQQLQSRSIYAVRVPPGKANTVIQVPHPKKLGKAMLVAVPADAIPGQPLFVPVPRKMSTKARVAISGGSGALATGAVVAFVAADGLEVVGIGGAAVAGLGATGLAPVLLNGAVVVGAVAASAAAIHYATRNPGKTVAIGALTIAGLAFADHVAEVGVVEAAGDVAETAGDAIEATGDAVETLGDLAERLRIAIDDAQEPVEGVADRASHFVVEAEELGAEVSDTEQVIIPENGGFAEEDSDRAHAVIDEVSDIAQDVGDMGQDVHETALELGRASDAHILEQVDHYLNDFDCGDFSEELFAGMADAFFS